jgi:hypothetical protein
MKRPISVTDSQSKNQQTKFIQIDEDGYFKMDGLRVSDAEAGHEWMKSLYMDERGRAWIFINGEPILVEAFDEPYVATDIGKSSSEEWTLSLPYGHLEPFQLNTLRLDDWDRFHGRTVRGIPFVLSRQAQAHFFNLVEEFEDDAITVDGQRYETQAWLTENPDANQNAWWTHIYRSEEPRWDLGGPSHALPALVPRLKLQKLRVLVAGAGAGHDAAWFASQGHLVTALDFSEEAIARARQKYGHLHNLTFLQADVFNLPSSLNSSFDLIFEHTLYCAITPSRRNELVKIWRRLLTEHGYLMGVFFTMDKPFGPPFGGSEWEIRARLSKAFKPLYWTRLRDSSERRLGHELFVYAQKTSNF